MSCYVSFFLGDFTKEDQDNFSWDKAPCLLSISARSEIGERINRFEYDKATLVTRDAIERIILNLNEKIEDIRKSIGECKEIKDSILRNIPVNDEDYDNAIFRVSQINSEMEDLENDITFAIKTQGVLDSIDDLIISNFPITVIVG